MDYDSDTLCSLCHSDYYPRTSVLLTVAVAAQHGNRLESKRVCADCCARIVAAVRSDEARRYQYNSQYYVMGCD